jgi:hypothetical protein
MGEPGSRDRLTFQPGDVRDLGWNRFGQYHGSPSSRRTPERTNRHVRHLRLGRSTIPDRFPSLCSRDVYSISSVAVEVISFLHTPHIHDVGIDS